MLGFLFILSHDLRWHRRRRKRDSPGSVSLPRGRPMGVAAKLVPVQWSPRKATKCLLCCWSTAHFFSYVNAVIRRWLWWIPTRRKKFQLPPPLARTCARIRAVSRFPPKVTHLTVSLRHACAFYGEAAAAGAYYPRGCCVCLPRLPTQMVVRYLLQHGMMSACRDIFPHSLYINDQQFSVKTSLMSRLLLSSWIGELSLGEPTYNNDAPCLKKKWVFNLTWHTRWNKLAGFISHIHLLKI